MKVPSADMSITMDDVNSGNMTIPEQTEPPHHQSAWQYNGSAASYDEDAVLMTLFVNLGLFVLLMCLYEFFSRMLPSVYRPNQLKVDIQSGTHHVQHLPRPIGVLGRAVNTRDAAS